MALYRQASVDRDDNESRRRQIKSRLEPIRELYRWGDIERDEYQRERDSLTAELGTLKAPEDMAAILARTAAFLSDLPLAWKQASQEQRNRLARLLFQSLVIKDNRVEAFTPQPDFAGFFILDCQSRFVRSGSDGIRTRDLSLDRAAC